MSAVKLLLITHEGHQHFSIHDDDDKALAALAHYVDDHWDEARLPPSAAHSNPSARIESWFAATRALYVIAEATIDHEAPL